MKIWFTADTHYAHKRAIELCKRPFSTVEEMDERMIFNHNAVVSKDDVYYHLGDFAFADHMPYLERLNGYKYLTLGNHDHSNRVNKACNVKGGWLGVDRLRQVTLPCGTRVVMCHYGMRVWDQSHRGAIHLYGHSHGNMPGDSQSCDVGVDAWGFQPVSIEMIKERLATLPKRSEPDHHQQ